MFPCNMKKILIFIYEKKKSRFYTILQTNLHTSIVPVDILKSVIIPIYQEELKNKFKN